MSVWEMFQIYLLVAIAISGTSYFNLYRPGIQLLEEIVEERTIYSSMLGATVWSLIALIAAPAIAVILLSDTNKEFINSLAVRLAEKHEEDIM